MEATTFWGIYPYSPSFIQCLQEGLQDAVKPWDGLLEVQGSLTVHDLLGGVRVRAGYSGMCLLGCC